MAVDKEGTTEITGSFEEYKNYEKNNKINSIELIRKDISHKLICIHISIIICTYGILRITTEKKVRRKHQLIQDH